jgi:predicted phage-related endonuclease
VKYQKLLKKLKGILSAERKAQLEKYSSLKKVLKSLRAEKKKLEKEIDEDIDDETRNEITSKLKVISKQRKKGLQVLQELKEERDGKDK